MKLATKISLSFLVTGLILTFIAASYFFIESEKVLKNQIGLELQSTLASRVRHIETYLRMLKIGVNQLSKSVVLEDFLKNPDDAETFKLAMKRLRRTKEAGTVFYEFFVMDRTGKIIASSEEKSIGSDKSTDVLFLASQDSPYIKDAYYHDPLGRGLLAVSSPVFDSETGGLLGVISARVNISDLNNIATDTTALGDTGEVYIVNKYGRMITPSRFLKDTFLKQKVRLVEKEDSVDIYLDYKGIPVLGAHSHVPEMRWHVLAEIDIREAYKPLHKLYILFTVVLFFVPIAAWLTGTFMARIIISPIDKLRKGTEIVAAGNLDYRVAMSTGDEIGDLSQSFDNMTEHLRSTTTSISELNREIAGRKAVEAKLALTALEWEMTFNSITDLVSLQDNNQKIIRVNKAYADFFRMKPDNIEGRQCYSVVHGTDVPCFNCPYREVMEKKKTVGMEYFEKRFGLHLEVTVSPIFNKDKEVVGMVHIIKNITERKRSEEALMEAWALKSRFTSMVSHELRTPLTAIKEGISIVEDGTAGELNDEQKEFLEMSKRNVDRLARLINDVLDYQKLESGKTEFKFEENDMNEVIKEAGKSMALVANGKGLEMIVYLDEELPKARFDRDKMTQVLTNLINNAIKFTDKGQISITCAKSGNTIRVTVEDTGPGIRKEDLPKLFHPFEQLEIGGSRKTGSTGLGLAICKEIVGKHNGKIWVESEPGKGSKFNFVIPIVERRVNRA
ncbi:MAG: HAMP domain-containing protein [Candidatus Omnitrophica bacterium]|nr:HAMP domain-containing protein [Candidatus Omnitrophota bacterium]